MSNDDDHRETGSINLSITLAPQSSMTSPLLNEYEVVNDSYVKRKLEPEKSSSNHVLSGIFYYIRYKLSPRLFSLARDIHT